MIATFSPSAKVPPIGRIVFVLSPSDAPRRHWMETTFSSFGTLSNRDAGASSLPARRRLIAVRYSRVSGMNDVSRITGPSKKSRVQNEDKEILLRDSNVALTEY